MSSYLHEDSLNGDALVLAINQPFTSVSVTGFELSKQLQQFCKQGRLAHLLMQDNVVWGTSRAAILVGPQILHWALEGSIKLYWPLDESVYVAELSSQSGFSFIVDGTENCMSVMDALEQLEKDENDDTIIMVVAGGKQSNGLEAAGFPPTKNGFVLDGSKPFKTIPVNTFFIRHRLLHFKFVWWAIGAIVVIVMAFSLIGLEREDPKDFFIKPVITLPPASGRPALAGELRGLALAIQGTDVLQLYGLSAISMAGSELTFSGGSSGANLSRLRELAAGFDAALSGRVDNWTLVMSMPAAARVKSQELIAIVDEVDRLVVMANQANIKTTVNESAATINPRWKDVKVVMVAPGISSLKLLAQLLASTLPSPNVKLDQASFAILADGRINVSLTVEVRGE